MTKLIPIVTSTFLICCSCDSTVNAVAFHPDITHVVNQSDLPAGLTEVVVKTHDGLNLRCLYLVNTASDKLVIYFHGNAGNVYQRIPDLIQLHNMGANVLGVSYRGYGRSDGIPSEAGVYSDGAAALMYAEKTLHYPTQKIFIFGRSIGTTVAVNTAIHQPLAGVILVTPLSTGKQEATAMGMGSLASVAGGSFDNIGRILKVSAPLLVIHGTADEVIPYSMGKAVFDRAVAPKSFVTITGGNHNNLQNFGAAYWQPIHHFMKIGAEQLRTAFNNNTNN